MKALALALLISIAPPPLEPCQVYQAQKWYEFVEEHQLQRVKVSCYIAPEGARTADGTPCYEGIVSSNREHLGMDMILYTDDLFPEALYECRDIGGNSMLVAGTAVDFYAASMERAWQFVGNHSEYVWVEWVERED